MLSVIVQTVSCGDGSTPEASPAANNKNLTTDSNKETDSDNPLAGQSLINAKFDVEVKVISSLEVCRGQIVMKITPGSGEDASALDIPIGRLLCPKLCVEIDFAKIMEPYSGKKKKDIKVLNGVFSLPVLGGMEFEPPRPLMPSFLALEREKLETLKVQRKVTMLDKGKPHDQGIMALQVNALDKPYKAEKLNRVFPKTLDYTVYHQGFDQGKMLKHFLFDKMHFIMAMDPIAILELNLEGKVKRMLEETGDNKMKDCRSTLGPITKAPIIGDIIGLLPITVKLTLNEMKNLADREPAKKKKRGTTDKI